MFSSILTNSTMVATVDPNVNTKIMFDEELMNQEHEVLYQQQQKQLPMAQATAVLDRSSTETTDNNKEIIKARWLLLGAAALYGTNFSCVKMLGGMEIPVGLASTLRFGLAALVTSPWLFLPTKSKDDGDAAVLPQEQQESGTVFLDSSQWQAAAAGFEVGLWNSIGYVAQAVGLETTLASKSAFLCSLAVVTVPLLDYATGKHLKRRELLGAVMALVGVGVLELGGQSSTDLLALSSGDLASLLQPLFFGMGFWRMEKAMHAHPDEANRSTAAQLLAVFLGSVVYTVITEPVADVSVLISSITHYLSDPLIVSALVWTGVVTTALTVYMETLALKTLTAAETTLIFSTEPLWGSAFAAVLLGETFGMDAVLGGMLIMAGCVYSNLGVSGMQALLSGKSDDDVITIESTTLTTEHAKEKQS